MRRPDLRLPGSSQFADQAMDTENTVVATASPPKVPSSTFLIHTCVDYPEFQQQDTRVHEIFSTDDSSQYAEVGLCNDLVCCGSSGAGTCRTDCMRSRHSFRRLAAVGT